MIGTRSATWNACVGAPAALAQHADAVRIVEEEPGVVALASSDHRGHVSDITGH